MLFIIFTKLLKFNALIIYTVKLLLIELQLYGTLLRLEYQFISSLKLILRISIEHLSTYLSIISLRSLNDLNDSCRQDDVLLTELGIYHMRRVFDIQYN